MAPVGQSDHDAIERQLKEAIQDIYQIMVQTNSYGTTSRPSNQVLEANVKQLSSSLQKIHHSVAPSMPSSRSLNLPAIPPELIQYVDAGRNPDIYTRELVEATRKSNQIMKGKMEAFGMFRNTLAAVMKDTMPELDVDVVNMVEKTGGKMEDVEKIRENINGKNI